jgi:2-oxoglutarate dehydrogenase E2 component (dihydrolipoamide succinyltransferase)
MRVDVVMPQMGESIAEGTITRWIKKVGETVERDEPIFEISTDKVDAEIPSPAAGVLREIRGQEGQTVEVNAVVAVIETDSSASGESVVRPPAPNAETAAPVRPARAAEPAARTAAGKGKGGDGAFVSPVVRRIAAEHGIDPASVPGTGTGGRVTKKDVLAFLEAGGAARAGAPAPAAAPAEPAPAAARLAQQPDAPAFSPDQPTAVVPMTQMRKIIARHMVESRRTSAHVHSVFEADVTRLVRLREKYQQAYAERHGTRLTYMAFFIRAACEGLRAWPIVNSSVDSERIVYHKDLNVGVAVALDWGLIVPVIKNADELSIAGLCKRVADLAQRARVKKLHPEEVQGGTFTITNPGAFGGLYGLPIIHQPQVAILGIGGIEKRPVVVDDAIAIRSMMYLSMSYDHRVVDGAVADQFLARVQHVLENFDESLL